MRGPDDNCFDLLAPFLGHMLSPEFCGAFEWRHAGDLLIWDNARMLHRATTKRMEAGQSRRMLRVCVEGEVPEAWDPASAPQKKEQEVDTDSPPPIPIIPESRRVRQRRRKRQQGQSKSGRQSREDVVDDDDERPAAAAEAPPPHAAASLLKDKTRAVEAITPASAPPLLLWDILQQEVPTLDGESDRKRCLRRAPELGTHDNNLSAWMQHAITFLRQEADLTDDKELALTIRRHPSILFADAGASGDNLQPCLDMLRTIIVDDAACSSSSSISDDDRRSRCAELRWVVGARPQLLCDAARLQASIFFLQAFPSTIDVAALCRSHAPVLERSVHQLQSTVDFFTASVAEGGAGMDAESAAAMFNKVGGLVWTFNPDTQLRPLVTYLVEDLNVSPSAENCWGLYAWPNTEKILKPAVDVLRGGGYDLDDIRRDPMLLCYSLEQRIKPRTSFVRERMRRGSLDVLPSVNALVIPNDADFCQYSVGATIEEFRAYSNTTGKSKK
jgi:hypothetical protein